MPHVRAIVPMYKSVAQGIYSLDLTTFKLKNITCHKHDSPTRYNRFTFPNEYTQVCMPGYAPEVITQISIYTFKTNLKHLCQRWVLLL